MASPTHLGMLSQSGSKIWLGLSVYNSSQILQLKNYKPHEHAAKSLNSTWLREATKPKHSRGTQQEMDLRWDTKRGLTVWGEFTSVQLEIYSKLPQVAAMAHFLKSLF